MAYPYIRLFRFLNSLNDAFDASKPYTHAINKTPFITSNLNKLYTHLFYGLNELLNCELTEMSSEQWSTLTGIIEKMIRNPSINWHQFNLKTNTIPLQGLLKFILHRSNTDSVPLLSALYERPDLDLNDRILNEDRVLTTCLYELMANLNKPAVFATLEKLVLIKGLDWGARTSSGFFVDKTPLFLLLLSFDKTYPAVRLLVQNTPLHLIPFLQPVGIKASQYSKRNTYFETIHAIDSTYQNFFKEVSYEEYTHYMMVVLAERIQNPQLCEMYTKKIPSTSKLYPLAMMRLFHIHLNNVRDHQAHRSFHNERQRLEIKRNNTARREDLLRALEVALDLPTDKTFYCTLIATKYIDGKAGVKPFPIEWDNPHLNTENSNTPWLSVLSKSPSIVRAYLDQIRSDRKSTKRLVDITDNLEHCTLNTSTGRRVL